MKKVFFPLFISIVFLVFTGCPEDVVSPPNDTLTDSELADQLVDEGLGYLTGSDSDWESAYSSFADAYDADPTNPTAALWYGSMTLADVMTDSEMRTFLTGYIGFTSYPASLNQALDPTETWFVQEVSVYYDGTLDYTYTLPGIPMVTSIATYDTVDGGSSTIITEQEYLLGLANSIVSKNTTGFNAARSALADVLNARLAEVITMLEFVPVGANIVLSWDYFFDTESEAINDGGWPVDGSGNAADVVIGTAEIKLLTASLYQLQALLYQMEVLDTSFPVQTFWDAVNPIDNPEGPDLTGLTNPIIDGFLSPSPDYVSSLGSAKSAMGASLSLMKAAFDTIATDRSGFFISGSSPVADIATQWTTDILPYVRMGSIATAKLLDSLQNNRDVFLPVDGWNYVGPGDFFSSYDTTAEWPTAVSFGTDGEPEVIPINLYPVYTSVVFAINALVDMDVTTGEPKLYKFGLTMDEATAMPTGLTDAHGGTPITTINSDDGVDSNAIYAVRFPDITLGGSIPMSTSVVTEIRNQLLDNLFPDLASADDLVVIDGDAVEVFLPVIPPHVAYSALNESTAGVIEPEYSYWMDDDGGQTFTPHGGLFETLRDDTAQYEIWSALIGDNTSVDATATPTLTIASNASDTSVMYRRYVYLVTNTTNRISFSVIDVEKNNVGDLDPNTGTVNFEIYTISSGGLADWMSEAEDGYLSYNWGDSPSSVPFSLSLGEYLILTIESDLGYYDGTTTTPVDVDITIEFGEGPV